MNRLCHFLPRVKLGLRHLFRVFSFCMVLWSWAFSFLHFWLYIDLSTPSRFNIRWFYLRLRLKTTLLWNELHVKKIYVYILVCIKKAHREAILFFQFCKYGCLLCHVIFENGWSLVKFIILEICARIYLHLMLVFRIKFFVLCACFLLTLSCTYSWLILVTRY